MSFKHSDDQNSAGGRSPWLSALLTFFKTLYMEMFELMGLNVLFLICCLPLVTIPVACTAMSKVTLCMVRQEDYRLWKLFWRTFRQNFRKSLLGGLPLFLGIGVCGYSAVFYYHLLEQPVFYVPFLLSVGTAVVLSGAGLFFFPLIATIDLPLRTLFKNAFLLQLLSPVKVLAALSFITVCGTACILLIPHTVPVLALLLFSLCSLISAFVVSDGIRRCEPPESDI